TSSSVTLFHAKDEAMSRKVETDQPSGYQLEREMWKNESTDQRKTIRAILTRPYESRLPTHKPNSVGISSGRPANPLGNAGTPGTRLK
ncbi:hypothetical protein, partial [Rhodopirellula bahusiensis]|uniref:hypothetical protein n=1 Tax=Rhodopirellula bahusiensis TaxID=2014065 RepID=UPI003263D772